MPPPPDVTVEEDFFTPQFPHLCSGAKYSCAPPRVDVGLAGRAEDGKRPAGPSAAHLLGLRGRAQTARGPRLLLSDRCPPPFLPPPPPQNSPPPRRGGGGARVPLGAQAPPVFALSLDRVSLALGGSLSFLWGPGRFNTTGSNSGGRTTGHPKSHRGWVLGMPGEGRQAIEALIPGELAEGNLPPSLLLPPLQSVRLLGGTLGRDLGLRDQP